MRVVVLTSDSGCQFALCHKLAPYCDLRAVIVSKNVVRRSSAYRARMLANSIQGRLFGRRFRNTWFGQMRKYERLYPGFPSVPITVVDNVNDEATQQVLRDESPDLVLVSGTNLIGRRLIELASRRSGMGMINMHTGLSPYVKGGPNCTNWCLAERTFHLIGNTVMWIDPGIDSGPLIATEQTPLTGQESLFEMHWSVMEHAHGLYVRVVRALAAGQTVPHVPQERIAKGRTFYGAEWNGRAILRAWKGFRDHYRPQTFRSPEFARLSGALTLVSLGRNRVGVVS